MKSRNMPSFLSTVAIVNGLVAIIRADSGTIVTGKLGNAQVITNNPPGAVYLAQLPLSQGILGSIVATTAGPLGTEFTVNFANLPTEGGPFLYHIHQAPVPADGNCTATGGHLDPYDRGETPACVMTQPETCQVGDLSGKHGAIPGTSFSTSYVDSYVSLNTISDAYMGNLSFVLHYANLTRITCANFTIAQGEILPTPSIAVAASVAASVPAGAATTLATAVGVNGPAGWPSGVPYPPTAAPGWPSGYSFGGNGLGGWGAWGFAGSQATAAPSVAAVSSIASAVAAGTAVAVGAAPVSSGSALQPLPGTISGASIPHGTGLIPTAAANVVHSNDGEVTEWSNYLLTVAGLFALTLIF